MKEQNLGTKNVCFEKLNVGDFSVEKQKKKILIDFYFEKSYFMVSCFDGKFQPTLIAFLIWSLAFFAWFNK